MSDKTRTTLPRRKFVQMTGAGVALVPLLPLAGCGGDKADSAASSAANDAADKAAAMADDAKDAATDMAAEVTEAAEDAADAVTDAASDAMDAAGDAVNEAADAVEDAVAGSDLPRLSEDDAQAQALQYVHDATTATADRYEAGQKCANCVLFTGGDKPWGPCSLFQGKLVNAEGWCMTYAPKG